MPGTDIMTHLPTILHPDPSRTVIRPFFAQDLKAYAVEGHSRTQRIVDRFMTLSEEQVAAERGRVIAVPRSRSRKAGWLVLTPGVGSVRNYCIGACLLDRDDPSIILKRMSLPLAHPSPRERDGYVLNVIYSCGGLVHDRTLLLPYGVADGFATFATVTLDDLLATMV